MFNLCSATKGSKEGGMTLEELEEVVERSYCADFGGRYETIIFLEDYIYSLRDVAASALNLLEKLEPKDLFLAARVEETIKRLREELSE